MADNISVLPHDDCCGCRACGDVCPKRCISFVKDKEGFFYPQVDEVLCISCSKCVKTCPEINPSYHQEPATVTAAFALSLADRDAGSSGGIFGLLARQILSKGGHVWGAAFDENLKLKHCRANSCEELQPLLRSKYVQSDPTGCYNTILREVKAGISTLFAGTPCQCNAVLNLFGTQPANLITVEVVCHGVPSQDLFDKSIEYLEKKNKYKIISFSFRSKYKGAQHPQAFTYTYEKDGKRGIFNGLHYQSPFYFGFQKYITLRPSCYACKWARPQRCADITLGDFWGIEKYNTALDAKQGVSQVLANTAKGQALIKELKDSGKISGMEFPVNVAIENNGCLSAPTRLKTERQHFFEDFAAESFDTVVKKHLVPKRQWIFDIYYGLPSFLRRLVRKIMDKRMRYE